MATTKRDRKPKRREKKIIGKGEADIIKVFVYGTLKQGHGNWRHYLEGSGAVLLGRCVISGPYIMRNLGYFPCICKVDDGADAEMVGEVYTIDKDTLHALDILEGHPQWYCREKVETEFGTAWCYFMPVAYDKEAPIIESGCWNASEEEKEWISARQKAS